MLALTTAALALTSGCSSDTSVGAPPAAPVDWHGFEVAHTFEAGPPGPTDKERKAGDTYVASLAAPGMPGLAAVLDADTHFTFPGMADARGKDAVVKAHDALFGAFDGRAFVQTRVFRTDSAHAIEWTMSGTQAREWMGIPATNKPVVLRGITLLWTRDEGSITDVHVLFDVTAAKAQLGAGPKELSSLTPPPVPTGAPQVYEQAHTTEESTNVAAVHTWLDSLEHNDDVAFLAGATDDVTIDVPERAQPMRGKDDLKAYFKAMHKAIGELDTRVDNAWGIGHFVVVDYSINGEQIGALGVGGWIPAKSDRVVRMHVIDVVDLQGGKVAHLWRYESPGEILITG